MPDKAVGSEDELSVQNAAGKGNGGGCCLGVGILLRNMIIPKELWHEFPEGLTLSISDYFLYQANFPNRITDPKSVPKPSDYQMPYEEVWITTKDDVKLYAYLIKQNTASHVSPFPTLIFFHGNAGCIGDRLENARLLHRLLRLNVLLVDYRGYGPSGGRPSEQGLYYDAKATYDYVQGRSDLDPNKIIVFGRSLGAAVAIYLCSRKKIRDQVAGLIVENTFTSVPSLAKKVFDFPGIKLLPRWFYSNKYNSKDKIKRIRCPTLFISSTNDELVPPTMMRKLFEICGSKNKEIKEINAGHCDAYDRTDQYATLMNVFLEDVFANPMEKESDLKGHISMLPSPSSTGKIPKSEDEDMWEGVNVGKEENFVTVSDKNANPSVTVYA